MNQTNAKVKDPYISYLENWVIYHGSLAYLQERSPGQRELGTHPWEKS